MSEKKTFPEHVAIIMDGNGRWATKRGKIRSAGHFAGTRTIINMIEVAKKAGIRYLTVYAFSTENWNRPKQEVDYLMRLVSVFGARYLKKMIANGVRLRAIGRLNGLPEAARNSLLKAIDASKNNTDFNFTIAVNYGGRAEIVDAVNRIIQEGRQEPVDESSFRQYLYAPEVPDPDLLIRAGGEKRLSNFLLWELSYSELYVTDTLWPDFDAAELQKALDAFAGRERKFGEIK